MFITHSGISQAIIEEVSAYLASLQHFDAIYVSNLLNKYHVKWIIIDDRKDVQIEFLLNNGYKVKEICQNNVLFEAK